MNRGVSRCPPATRRASTRACDSGLLHPVALGALAVLILNDHVLKARYPGWVTGKLSDVAGMIVFPLFACAICAIVIRRADRQRMVAVCVAATALGFALVKLWPPATHACELTLGALQWPFSAGLQGGFADLAPVAIVRDPSDLLALPFAAIALWLPRQIVPSADPQ
jgi:hypothetical protein